MLVFVILHWNREIDSVFLFGVQSEEIISVVSILLKAKTFPVSLWPHQGQYDRVTSSLFLQNQVQHFFSRLINLYHYTYPPPRRGRVPRLWCKEVSMNQNGIIYLVRFQKKMYRSDSAERLCTRAEGHAQIAGEYGNIEHGFPPFSLWWFGGLKRGNAMK